MPVSVQELGTFELSSRNLTSLRWLAETGDGLLTPYDLPRDLPGVGSISFGLFTSPNFISAEAPVPGSIPQTPTGSPVKPWPAANFMVPVSFHVFLPASPKPGKGFPVAIYAHGLTDNQFGAATTIASTLAQAGIATLAVEILGHGFGPGGKVELGGRRASSNTIAVLPAGRSVRRELSSGGASFPDRSARGIVPGRQRSTCSPWCAQSIRIGYFKNLDPSRIFLIGQSFGSIVGSLVSSTEPRIRASVLNVPAGSAVDTVRLARDRGLAVLYLAIQAPPLLNLPTGDFNDNYVYRGKPPLVNDVPGAPQIQASFEVADWLNMSAGPLAFAAGLKRAPVLFQFAKGDEEVANPTNSAIILAASGQATSRFLRFDKAKEIACSQLPTQPHRFLANPEIFSTPAQQSIAMAAQRQVAGFFASNGGVIPDANPFLDGPFTGIKLFETPSNLPEDLNFDRNISGVCH